MLIVSYLFTMLRYVRLCLCRKQLSEQAQERVISSFRRYVDEIFSLLGYYTVHSGNSRPRRRASSTFDP